MVQQGDADVMVGGLKLMRGMASACAEVEPCSLPSATLTPLLLCLHSLALIMSDILSSEFLRPACKALFFGPRVPSALSHAQSADLYLS